MQPQEPPQSSAAAAAEQAAKHIGRQEEVAPGQEQAQPPQVPQKVSRTNQRIIAPIVDATNRSCSAEQHSTDEGMKKVNQNKNKYNLHKYHMLFAAQTRRSLRE